MNYLRRAVASRRELLSAPICHRARSILRDECGQGLAEYALILSLVGAIAVAALTFVGKDVSSMISTLASQL